jgi:hypothetical protein
MLADATGECLPFEIDAARRMRRPPRQAHAVPAERANGIIGRAEAYLDGAILGGWDQANFPHGQMFRN